MTHSDLVARAVRWLRSYHGCDLVLAEYVTAWPEQPDAIGWRGPCSTLAECKVSRSDFLADQRKDRALGLGVFRWYVTPAGLLRPNEIPDGWGLAEVTLGGTVRRVVEARARESYAQTGEITILLSVHRRHELGVPWDPKIGRFARLNDANHPRNRVAP